MAQAGTTKDLKQPAMIGSGRQAGLWMALITGAAVLAIALVFVMTQMIGSKPVSVSQSAPQTLLDRGADRGAVSGLVDRGADRGAVSSVPQAEPWYAPHSAATVTADDQIAAALRAAALASADRTYDKLRAAAFAETWNAKGNAVGNQDQTTHAPGRGPLP
jgi:hypothetical protein